jgi:N-acetylglutamate synthase-like GNAT family acetyltransferase
MIRTATRDDTRLLTKLINDAFVVEAFFKIGDRTSADEIIELMRDGEFLILEDPEPGTSNLEPGALAGCVYLTSKADRAYFGMLSIDPSKQGRGLGTRLIDAAEARARAHGCRYMDIHIVNLREDLPAYYRRFGYAERGTLPFSDPSRASRPCHFIVMSKNLAPP